MKSMTHIEMGPWGSGAMDPLALPLPVTEPAASNE